MPEHGQHVEPEHRHQVDMGDSVCSGRNVTRHHFIHVHKEDGLGPVPLLDEVVEVLAVVGGDVEVLDDVDVVLDELGGEGVGETVDPLVVIEHVEEGLGAAGAVGLAAVVPLGGADGTVAGTTSSLQRPGSFPSSISTDHLVSVLNVRIVDIFIGILPNHVVVDEVYSGINSEYIRMQI